MMSISRASHAGPQSASGVSLSKSDTMSLLGEPIVYSTLADKIKATVSVPSFQKSSIGEIVMLAVAWPSGITTEEPIAT